MGVYSPHCCLWPYDKSVAGRCEFYCFRCCDNSIRPSSTTVVRGMYIVDSNAQPKADRLR